MNEAIPMSLGLQEYVESKQKWFNIIKNIQEHLFSLNEENYQETEEILLQTKFQYSKETTYTFLDLILIAMKSRPLNIILYKRLLDHFSQDFHKFNFSIPTFLKMHYDEPNYLNQNNYELWNNFHELTIETMKDNSLRIFHAIYSDSVDKLQKIFSNYDVFINSLIETKEITKLVNITFPKSELHIIDLAAYFKAVNIFKFLFLSRADISHLTLTCAIVGGSIDIIKIIHHNKKNRFEFDQSHLISAIQLHHHDLIEYIIDNSPDICINHDVIASSIEYYNIDYFLNHCQQMIIEIESGNDDTFSALLFDCLKWRHIDLFAVLLHIPSIDVNQYHILFNEIKGTIIHAAARMESLSYMKFLLEVESVDPNILTCLNSVGFIQSSSYIYSNGLSPLHIAVLRRDVELVKLLLSLKSINPNIATRDTQETPLHYACRNNSQNIIELLLNHPRIDANKMRIPRNKLFDGKTPADISLSHRDFNSFIRIKRHGGKTSSYFLFLFLFHVVLFLFSIGHTTACALKKAKFNPYLSILELGAIFRFLMSSFTDALFDED